MSTKKITIEAPEGHVVNYDVKKGTVTFDAAPKNVKERILTFDDVLKELEINPANFLLGLENLSPDEVAYRRLKLIIKAFNEGWEPDWENSNESKYYAWFKMGSSSGAGFAYNGCDCWLTFSNAGSRLCFKSSDLAEHVGKLFIDDYKQFLSLNK
jgi:hypothetical protein